ncbi:MAG: hypothetical protein K2X27_07560, partial [Candidatus Obscuribacterales bacterium]|nr:hypothetical protein [Candidatus Obscuribacterales bacterium]
MKFSLFFILSFLTLVLSSTASDAETGSMTYAEMYKIRLSGNWKKIKAAATQLLENNPKDFFSRKCLVEADIQLHFFEDAEKNLRRLQSDHKYNDYFLWAFLNDSRGDLKTALKYVDLMLAKEGSNLNPRIFCEDVYYKANRNKWILLCAKNRGFDQVDWYLSGGSRGNHERAFSELQKLMDNCKAGTNWSTSVHIYSFLYELLKKMPIAKLNPDELVWKATSYYVNPADEPEALKYCEAAAKARPEKVLKVLEAYSISPQDPKRVLALMDKMEEPLKNSSQYYIQKSLLYKCVDDFNKALQCAERALSLDPCENNYWLRYEMESLACFKAKNHPSRLHRFRDLNEIVKKFP